MENKRVKAIRDCFVLVAKSDNSGYGNRVYLRDKDGHTIMYAHLESFTVKNGDKLKAGKEFGVIGGTGYGTGDHLHLSYFKPGCKILNSKNTSDPMPYIEEYGYPCDTKITNPYGSEICHPKQPFHEGVDFSAKTLRKNND